MGAASSAPEGRGCMRLCVGPPVHQPEGANIYAYELDGDAAGTFQAELSTTIYGDDGRCARLFSSALLQLQTGSSPFLRPVLLLQLSLSVPPSAPAASPFVILLVQLPQLHGTAAPSSGRSRRSHRVAISAPPHRR